MMMNNVRKYITSSISLKDKYYEMVIKGNKKSTIRQGYVLFNDIDVSLVFELKSPIQVRITKLDYSKTFGSITKEDAVDDGYYALENLRIDLKTYYPELLDRSPVTIIHFELIR